ncbi:MAG: efflux RND transporter permease subunit [Pseudomonadota bacterium]
MSPVPKQTRSVVGIFAAHPVAANLLMVMMLMAGVFGLSKLNTQFFPNFALDMVYIGVSWTGAPAEDVESGITTPIEQELRSLDGLNKMTSTSAEGYSAITLEYREGTDMGIALDQVKERIALVRNLPGTAEEPEIRKIVRYEPVARLRISGPSELAELRPIARQIEKELLDAGITNIRIAGLPDEELAIQVPSARLRELDLSLEDIAARVSRGSRDLPAGTIGRDEVSRQLRALEQRRDEEGFARLPIVSDEAGRFMTLGEIAEIVRRPRDGQTQVHTEGIPAVELHLRRAESSDSLEAARIVDKWKLERLPEYPANIEIELYDESWKLISERIWLLVRNGGGGLVLVVTVLFLFLNTRVAFWVAVGIPVSFMATLGVLYVAGGSVNMISLFALIMALGIIVDDAIVVGEDALTHYQGGAGPLDAAEAGAQRMLAPVLSSSLTTIAAFLPLMLVGGIIGNILFAIPLVIICVILASLVESFLVLPGHLRHTFTHASATPGRLRQFLDNAFDRFKNRVFRPVVTLAVRNAGTTIALTVASLILTVGLLAGGRIQFNFFPTAESTILTANIGFVAGTRADDAKAYADQALVSLREVDEALGGDLVVTAVLRTGQMQAPEGTHTPRGDQYATILVELQQPDQRDVRNTRIISEWRERLELVPGLETLSVFERRGGPPGRDVDVSLQGDDAGKLKLAALELQETLKGVAGISGIEDDLPFGPEQLIYALNAQGRALGLTVESVGQQLRAAYDGQLAQIYQDDGEEIEVRVVLPDAERNQLASLENLGVKLPGGETVPLPSVVDIRYQRGFEVLRHLETRLSVKVSGDIDPAVNNTNKVNALLEAEVLPTLASKYGVQYQFEGRAADQAETLADMRLGMRFGLAMIYLVLAWVFASYTWPLVVMVAIPFGLVGALGGHYLLSVDLTILSLFGFFGLSGIVVNDSIILVTFFKELRDKGMHYAEAIVEAACQRLRAVLLTSLTTIGGLTPLMFETSLQAQFLIPMAVSISFGLGFATLLVLVVIPALLYVHESCAAWWQNLRQPQSPSVEAAE